MEFIFTFEMKVSFVLNGHMLSLYSLYYQVIMVSNLLCSFIFSWWFVFQNRTTHNPTKKHSQCNTTKEKIREKQVKSKGFEGIIWLSIDPAVVALSGGKKEMRFSQKVVVCVSVVAACSRKSFFACYLVHGLKASCKFELR